MKRLSVLKRSGYGSRKILGFLAFLTLTTVCLNTTEACTTFIAGHKVTADGSRIVGRTDDSEDLDVTVIKRIPAVKHSGAWTFTNTKTKFKGEMPASGCSYLAVPSANVAPGEGTWDEAAINEYHVCLTATESIYANQKALAADAYVQNGIDESIIPTIVMPYVKNAQEGVERLGSLIDKYGSMEGNALVFADDKDTWYMEIYTGHQWAAIRFPDDKYAVITNDSMLGNVDVNDQANVKVSKNLVKLAKEHNFLKEDNGQIHLAHTYGGPHRDYSQLRVWAAQRKLSPSQSKAYNVTTTYDMMLKPDKKISLADAMELFRYRYEDIGYNANLHPTNRSIGINRTAEAHLFWLRDGKPQTMWVALANQEMSVFLPYYGNVTKLPAAFSLETKDYDSNSAYYKFRSLSGLAVQNRAGYGKEVRDSWRKMELGLINNMPDMDARYLAAGQTSQAANSLCGAVAQKALDTADALYKKTMTAFLLSTVQDGNASNATALNATK